MSNSTQIVQAVCKYPTGQPRQGKYGEYISALFTAPECGDVRIFGNPDDDLLKSIKKGQMVWLVDNNRGGYKLAAAPAINSTNSNNGNGDRSAQPRSPEQSENRKGQILAYIQSHTRLFKTCYLRASEEMAEFVLDEDNLRCIATTIYIQTQRKFDL
ncbi:hypothetical protein Pse7367_0877 [Thalassoporum mexicanum PCC 7367]|uniref:hypothetical protein n=1 Tax=Thalassoporum mexicanum TaxID=3457544 RepID=UPI00029FC34D|nr:hypothetical protein [Pseudanabaena sp. PCC 7367]AFY69177.1 hypothetical protein Pse7367_0877 [Pseudanabaena sp. PCC 7367]